MPQDVPPENVLFPDFSGQARQKPGPKVLSPRYKRRPKSFSFDPETFALLEREVELGEARNITRAAEQLILEGLKARDAARKARSVESQKARNIKDTTRKPRTGRK